MKEDVSVRVCGVQRCPGAEEDVSELVCEGVFKHTADGWLLAYEEPSEAGTVKTLLRFADGRVTLTRRGAVRSEMTFAAGECHTIFYELPLGRLTMELHTDSVCASFDGACGTLELCYRLAVRDETVSENRLTVTLAPRCAEKRCIQADSAKGPNRRVPMWSFCCDKREKRAEMPKSGV